jgi:hypothetical protein
MIGRALSRHNKATFSCGMVGYAIRTRGFTHAWRVSGVDADGRATGLLGWARSEASAQQEATVHAGAAATRWSKVKAEVVKVE